MNNNCFHCNEPVPAGLNLVARINDRDEAMCCRGCQAIAEHIVELGLAGYYKHRTEYPEKPEDLLPDSLRTTHLYDQQELQQNFVTDTDKELRTAHLIIEGIVCPACVWLNESYLSKIEGIKAVNVNFTTQRAIISWDNSVLSLSKILDSIVYLGYKAYPYSANQRQQTFEKERRSQLLRLAVAGLLGMQVMMIAIALYFGDWFGIKDEYRQFFYWVSLILTIPVVFYSAFPILMGAVRDLSLFRINMDVPITFGLLIALFSSCYSMISDHGGHVYFDSAVMFVFFISLGRYYEFVSRKKSMEQIDRISRIIPLMALKLFENGPNKPEAMIAVSQLKSGDRIIVKPGEVIPVDGEVINGQSSVNESIITGESLPVHKQIGNEVLGGSTNIESPLTINVTRIGDNTTASLIARLIETASNHKPETVQLADQLASWFISLILVIAASVALFWFMNNNESWLAITLSVLIITCPCALSLATPTAIASATTALMKQGVAIVNQTAIENINKASHFIFDKTGTLTKARLSVKEIVPLHHLSKDELLSIAAALESYSEHPVGKAIVKTYNKTNNHNISNIENTPGMGIKGIINNETFYIGTEEYIAQHTQCRFNDELRIMKYGKTVILATKEHLLGSFRLDDSIRENASKVVHKLHHLGKKVFLLSGDSDEAVKGTASTLEIKQYFSRLKPDQKLSLISDLQNAGENVCVIGDGINDSPSLAQADTSIAVANASDISKLNSDIVIMNNDISSIIKIITISDKTTRTIMFNLLWAIGYNLIAVPFAAAGYVAPWLAAIGMSLSSLIVVINSSRIRNY